MVAVLVLAYACDKSDESSTAQRATEPLPQPPPDEGRRSAPASTRSAGEKASGPDVGTAEEQEAARHDQLPITLADAPNPAGGTLPLMDNRKPSSGCGTARPNPWGIVGWSDAPSRRDGTCGVCLSAPAAIPPCPEKRMAELFTRRFVTRSLDRDVAIRGHLALATTHCTRVGGPCACNNGCSAAMVLEGTDVTLSLEGSGHDAAPPLSAIPREVLGRSMGVVCRGDEASLCCPLQIDGAEKKIDVIVQGKLHDYPELFPWRAGGDDSPFGIAATTICRLN